MPYYGAWVQENDKRVIIWRAKMVSSIPETPVGKIINIGNELFLSFCDGTLLITKYEVKQVEI
jgi:methionyl-tRNA formyltransferase